MLNILLQAAPPARSFGPVIIILLLAIVVGAYFIYKSMKQKKADIEVPKKENNVSFEHPNQTNADSLSKLQELLAQGLITTEEYNKLLGEK